MTSKHLWNILIEEIGKSYIEIQTNPIQKNRQPLWFKAVLSDRDIIITSSIHNKPSSKITTPRKVPFKEFNRVYHFYLQRKQGHSVSANVTRITVNQVYNYGLMNFAEQCSKGYKRVVKEEKRKIEVVSGIVDWDSEW